MAHGQTAEGKKRRESEAWKGRHTKWWPIKDGTGGVRGPPEEEVMDQTPAVEEGGAKSRKNLGALLWPLALHIFYISN